MSMEKNIPLRNYNIFALQGDDEVTDMDVVEEMGLDPAVAHTPEINRAAVEKMRLQNIQGYMKSGMEESDARQLADFHANAAKASINAAMREQQIDYRI